MRTAFRGSVFIKRYRRLLNRIAMKFVVQQILDLGPSGQRNFAIGNSGIPTIAQPYAVVILITFIGIRYNCHIRVPFFIADEMDLAKTILGMFASSSAKRPCNMCDCVFKDNMLINGNPRDYEAIHKVSANGRKYIALYNLFDKKLSYTSRDYQEPCLTRTARKYPFTLSTTRCSICLDLIQV